MIIPIQIRYDESTKTWDLYDAAGKLLGYVYAEESAREIALAVNDRTEEAIRVQAPASGPSNAGAPVSLTQE